MHKPIFVTFWVKGVPQHTSQHSSFSKKGKKIIKKLKTRPSDNENFQTERKKPKIP